MKLINYTTKPGLAAENRAKIAAVFEALHEVKPADIRYAAFESGDGHFLHVVEATESASEALRNLPAFRNFTAELRQRQEAPQDITELKIVGSYGGLVGE